MAISFERGGDLLKPGSADTVDALLVLLDLLKADAKLFAELCLRDLLLDAPQPNSLAELNVGLAGTALLDLVSLFFEHSLGSPPA